MSENNISTQNLNCEHSNTVLCDNVPCLCTNSLEQNNNEISVYSDSTVVENSETVSELETGLAEDHLKNVSKRELEEDELISVSRWNICIIILSVTMHMADVYSDIILAITYIRDKEVIFFFLTAGCIYLASGAITLCSKICPENWNKSRPVLLWFIIFLFNLEPVLYNITIANCIIQITKTDQRENKIQLYEKMVEKQETVALMKLLEGLYESAPQLSLQIAIMYNITEKADETAKISMFQYISIITSLLGLTTTIYSAFKLEFLDKLIETSITICAARIILLFLWFFPIIVSRILSISFLFLKHPYRLLFGLLINFIVFNTCLISTRRNKESSNGMALFLTLFPFSPYEVISLSLPYFMCFHSIHFVGNILSCLQWMYDMKYQTNTFHIYMAIINIVSFIIGFSFGLIFIKMKKRLNIS